MVNNKYQVTIKKQKQLCHPRKTNLSTNKLVKKKKKKTHRKKKIEYKPNK